MTVVECEIPASSVLERSRIEQAYFRDFYRAPLVNADRSMVDIFFAIFGYHPLWMKLLLIVRNSIARRCGLDAPSVHEIMKPEVKQRYDVGEKIGVWPVFALGPNELVAGRNNKHLDFRLSVLRENQGSGAQVVVSTVCTVHNRAGKVYLFFIVPFHRWGVRRLISRAVNAKRL